NLLPADSLPVRCSLRGVRHRPFEHPPGPDSHRASSTSPPTALRRFSPSRQTPPSPTCPALAQPEPAPYLASATNRAVETPIPFLIPPVALLTFPVPPVTAQEVSIL